MPRRVGAVVGYSDQILRQAANLEQLLKDDFTQAISQQIDFAVKPNFGFLREPFPIVLGTFSAQCRVRHASGYPVCRAA
jgi:hypothetical protein